MESIGESIRDLSRDGLSPKEIISLGYKRSTVYHTLRKRSVLPDRKILEELLQCNIEMLRILRELTNKPDIIDRLA